MKIQWKTLIICIAIPLGVGLFSSLLTRGSMAAFGELDQPALSPPAWLFPVVWTILYVLMGTASYFVAVSKKPNGGALITYGLQLIFNFFWPIIFFNMQAFLFAFIWLVILWILIVRTTMKFFGISTISGILMIPYIIWVTFAGYLNLSIYLLNRS